MEKLKIPQKELKEWESAYKLKEILDKLSKKDKKKVFNLLNDDMRKVLEQKEKEIKELGKKIQIRIIGSLPKELIRKNIDQLIKDVIKDVTKQKP